MNSRPAAGNPLQNLTRGRACWKRLNLRRAGMRTDGQNGRRFSHRPGQIQAIRVAKTWTKENFQIELTRALTTLENARMEWNSARLKLPLAGESRPAAVEKNSPAPAALFAGGTGIWPALQNRPGVDLAAAARRHLPRWGFSLPFSCESEVALAAKKARPDFLTRHASLEAEIAALEAEIKRLDNQLQQPAAGPNFIPPPHPR